MPSSEAAPDATAVLPLVGRRVLDFGGLPSAYATRMLRLLGADVIMVEPPGGAPIRREPPFIQPNYLGIPFAHFCLGKRSVCLDLSTRDGCEVMRELLSLADLAVLDQTTARATAVGDLTALLERPGLHVAEFRDVARDSQWGEYTGSNLVDEALSGLLTLSGEEGRPPTQIGGYQTWHMLSLHALPAIVAALTRTRDEEGSVAESSKLEINAQEAAATAAIQTGNIHFYAWEGVVPSRPGAPSQDGDSLAKRFRPGMITCMDGFVSLTVPMHFNWDNFLHWLAVHGVTPSGALNGHEYFEAAHRFANRTEIESAASEVGRTSTMLAFCESAQRYGLMAMPVHAPTQVAADEHLRARGMIFEHPLSAFTDQPGYDLSAPFSATPTLTQNDLSLPLLPGRDTIEVVTTLGRYSAGDLEALVACGAIRPAVLQH